MSQTLKCRRRQIGSRRFEISIDVHLLCQNAEGIDQEGIGVIRNLSMRGALIETHASMQANDRLLLYLTLIDRPEPLEIRSATVRWVRERQLGVEFLKLERATSQVLMRYLSAIHAENRSNSESS